MKGTGRHLYINPTNNPCLRLFVLIMVVLWMSFATNLVFGDKKNPASVTMYDGLSRELEDSLIKALREVNLRKYYVKKEAEFRNKGNYGDIVNMSNWIEDHLHKDNIEGITLIYELRSAAYASIGDYEAMFDDIEKSLDIQKDDSLKFRDGVLYLWLLDFHVTNKQFDLAQQYLDKAKKIVFEHKDSVKINDGWKNLSFLIHLMQGQLFILNKYWDSAIHEFEEAGKYITGELHTQGLNILYFFLYKDKGDYYVADSIYQNGLKYKNIPFINEGAVKIEYVKMLLNMGEIERAKSELGRINPDSIHINYRSSLLRLTSNIYELEENYKFAFHYLDKSIHLKDSLESEYKRVYARHAADRFEMRQVEKSLRKEKLENLRNVIFIIILGASLVSAGIWVAIVIRRNRKRKRDQIIAESKLANRSAALSSAVMMADNYKAICEDIKTIVCSNFDAEKKFTEINRLLKASNNPVEPLHHVSATNDETTQEFMDKLRYVHPDLTNAQLRMAQLIFMNISNKDIAEMQNLSIGTVKNQKSALRKKLGIEIPTEQYLKRLSVASPSELEDLAKKK